MRRVESCIDLLKRHSNLSLKELFIRIEGTSNKLKCVVVGLVINKGDTKKKDIMRGRMRKDLIKDKNGVAENW